MNTRPVSHAEAISLIDQLRREREMARSPGKVADWMMQERDSIADRLKRRLGETRPERQEGKGPSVADLYAEAYGEMRALVESSALDVRAMDPAHGLFPRL